MCAANRDTGHARVLNIILVYSLKASSRTSGISNGINNTLGLSGVRARLASSRHKRRLWVTHSPSPGKLNSCIFMCATCMCHVCSYASLCFCKRIKVSYCAPLKMYGCPCTQLDAANADDGRKKEGLFKSLYGNGHDVCASVLVVSTLRTHTAQRYLMLGRDTHCVSVYNSNTLYVEQAKAAVI